MLTKTNKDNNEHQVNLGQVFAAKLIMKFLTFTSSWVSELCIGGCSPVQGSHF